PGLEHRLEGVGFEQQVPEAVGPRQVDDEQDAADDETRQHRVIAQPCERPILRTAEEVDQCRQEIAASREPAEAEIADDEPAPMRGDRKPGAGRDLAHVRVSSRSPARRSRKLKMPIRPTSSAPTTEKIDPEIRLRLGIFGSGGSAYTSGRSTRRKNEFSPP